MSIDRVVGASGRRRGRRVPRLAFPGGSPCLGSPFVSEEQEAPLRRFLRVNWGLCAQLFSSSRAPAPISSGPGESLTHIMLEERTLPEKVKEQVALVGSGINHSNHCLAAQIPGSRGIEKSV